MEKDPSRRWVLSFIIDTVSTDSWNGTSTIRVRHTDSSNSHHYCRKKQFGHTYFPGSAVVLTTAELIKVKYCWRAGYSGYGGQVFLAPLVVGTVPCRDLPGDWISTG